ncbi:hypothetical protein HY605_04335 [Candidatus Peregrinibacteria bacterium]|nr:hypothetical protein [Candidatus Peregrinibacteria bacterium]
MEKEFLTSLLDRINFLFDYPENEKMIPGEIIWANQTHETNNALVASKFIDDFNVPDDAKVRLVKIELERGVDDFQMLNAGLYKLKERKIIYDHHYYLDIFGTKNFIIAVDEDFTEKYEQAVATLGIRQNKIRKIYIFRDGSKYNFLIVGENGVAKHITSSADVKWHEMLVNIAIGGEYPYDKSNEPINFSFKHAIYCKNFFTATTIIRRATKEDGVKVHKLGEVVIEHVENRDSFSAVKRNLKFRPT